ncbi:BrnT family toxin [Rhizobium sp. Leaf341]|uniref:BrnT family toxin n=1 Tax=Rhizobium sp. Leaf341 TaxID=1736344 RepID=UPI0007139A0B|nr:BrnT family toxin [Rhizobium sp. Leaf341]KQR77792.1 hypothetical protein ASG03_15575 [Rhizobium sp. Leaf341]
MKITYDEPKREKTLMERGLDFADLTVEFFETAAIFPAKKARFMALNWFQGTAVVVVIFKPLGTEAISVVSMRRASRKERGLL